MTDTWLHLGTRLERQGSLEPTPVGLPHQRVMWSGGREGIEACRGDERAVAQVRPRAGHGRGRGGREAADRGGPSCGPSTRPLAMPGARRAAPSSRTSLIGWRGPQCFPNSLWDQRDHDLRSASKMGPSCDLDALVVGCTPGTGHGFASSSLCGRPAGATAGPRADGVGAGTGAGAAVAVIETAKQAAIAVADGVLWSPVWGGVARPDSV
jgi:hypothetical protein